MREFLKAIGLVRDPMPEKYQDLPLVALMKGFYIYSHKGVFERYGNFFVMFNDGSKVEFYPSLGVINKRPESKIVVLDSKGRQRYP